MQTLIDLKEHPSYVPQYVELRNRYVDLLLTNPVDPEATRRWLVDQDVEVRCLIDGGVLIGSVILYLHRDGEVAFFVRSPGKGLARPLLQAVEDVARERGCAAIWAWVLSDNEPAKKAFLKAGWFMDGITEKWHNQASRTGHVLRKRLERSQPVA